ncbi:hypothetical protein C6N75_12475 [Streptomyces solincola]|uniref:Uncharacterized protein n=1 Tax=Streptomyces solincola TaxID=2100817 RepID=A0A2S9PWU4_9ACTN|nr:MULTISPECIES: hypothetical protein [Streptomyces]PRH78904.1 hypothetical protein C6N75_12475 [Streptomyces solincola]
MSAKKDEAAGAGQDAAAAAEVDAHLEVLLRMAEVAEDGRLAITLTTSGGVVGGFLVGSEAWARRWEQVVAETAGPEHRSEEMALLPRTVQDALGGGEATDTQGLHRFLHLVDVVFLSVPGSPSAPLWRGRTADVSGWALGGPKPAR